MTCTIPWPSLPSACSSIPKSAQFFSSAAICSAAALSRMGIFPSRPRGVVGVGRADQVRLPDLLEHRAGFHASTLAPERGAVQ
jgi:hypothetical protein